MRVGYLIFAGGLMAVVWPELFRADRSWELMEGAVNCMLVAASLLALAGLRHPVRMVPVLLWESIWKLLWLGLVGVPQWASGAMDTATSDVLVSCLWVVIILVVIPWGHVWARYVVGPGNRWRSQDAR